MASSTFDLHKLSESHTFWVTYFKKSKDKQLEEFEDNLMSIAKIDTVEDFWTVYEHMKRPSVLPRGCEFFLFRSGIKPLWEDTANIGGGRFYISMKKSSVTNKIWEDLQIGFLLTDSTFDKLNGIVLNVRQAEIFLSIWTKSLQPEELERYREWVRKTLDFPSEQVIDYKQHPNNLQLIKKQEELIKEEEDRIKKECEFEKKKVEDAERKRAKTMPGGQITGKTSKKEAEQIAQLVQEIDESFE